MIIYLLSISISIIILSYDSLMAIIDIIVYTLTWIIDMIAIKFMHYWFFELTVSS